MIQRFRIKVFQEIDKTGTGVGKQIDVDRLGYGGCTQRGVYLDDE